MHQSIQPELTPSAGKTHPCRFRGSRYFLLGLAALCLAVSAQGSPVDQTLYTTYTITTDHTSVHWIVCGATKDTSGCYDSGSIGPFGKVGALIEGLASSTTTTVTRPIYVVDIASGSSKTGVDLYVYTKTDVVSSTTDKTTFVLSDKISLPLTGGSTARTSMAANNNFLFIGTNQTPYAVLVAKKGLAVTQTLGFSPPINVTAITADAYGYVTVTFGTFGSGENGFYLFGPNGNSFIEDGGGAPFMLSTTQAILPSSFK